MQRREKVWEKEENKEKEEWKMIGEGYLECMWSWMKDVSPMPLTHAVDNKQYQADLSTKIKRKLNRENK